MYEILIPIGIIAAVIGVLSLPTMLGKKKGPKNPEYQPEPNVQHKAG